MNDSSSLSSNTVLGHTHVQICLHLVEIRGHKIFLNPLPLCFLRKTQSSVWLMNSMDSIVYSFNPESGVTNTCSYTKFLMWVLGSKPGPHAYTVGMLQTPGPHAYTVGMLQTPGSQAYTVGMLQTPSSHAYTVGMLQTPGPHVCTVGMLHTPGSHACRVGTLQTELSP